MTNEANTGTLRQLKIANKTRAGTYKKECTEREGDSPQKIDSWLQLENQRLTVGMFDFF